MMQPGSVVMPPPMSMDQQQQQQYQLPPTQQWMIPPPHQQPQPPPAGWTPAPVPPPQPQPQAHQQMQAQQYYSQYHQMQPTAAAATTGSSEIRSLWIGDLQPWMEETYLVACFAGQERTTPVLTLSEIYQTSKRLLLRTRDGLERLERLEFSSSNGMDSPEISYGLKKDISQIQSLCVKMDRLWCSVGAKSQRDLWKRKVEQVAEEAESLKESLDKHFLRNQKRTMEARERAELLGRANGESSHVMRIFDEEAQAMQSARNSSMMLEEAYSTGVAILFKYSEQRDRLKRAQRKVLDILNTVGLSNSILKLIERRHRVDKWIKYAGMIITIVILFAFIRWTR